MKNLITILEIIWTVILTFTAFILFPLCAIALVVMGVNFLQHHGVRCKEYKIAKSISPQTNFWGTVYYVVATDGNSNLQTEAPKIGSKYCFETEIFNK